MTFKNIDTKDNHLLKRKEISAILESISSPSREEVKEIISKEINADKELTIIKSIEGKFGSDNFSISALVYNSKKDMEDTEFQPKTKTVPGQAQAPAK